MSTLLARLNRGDGLIAGVALALMLAIPLAEMILRSVRALRPANSRLSDGWPRSSPKAARQ